eukprot:CCRYP_002344-RA/>CCRYP_002344-RA protein AED:0.64 eAED:0.49 QI:0/-1/0/1/-1/0/1/0/99
MRKNLLCILDTSIFALAEWVDRDIMLFECVNTSINMVDHMTEILDRTLFYRHVDYIMGHIPPLYSPCYTTYSKQAIPSFVPGQAINDMTLNDAATAAAA